MIVRLQGTLTTVVAGSRKLWQPLPAPHQERVGFYEALITTEMNKSGLNLTAKFSLAFLSFISENPN